MIQYQPQEWKQRQKAKRYDYIIASRTASSLQKGQPDRLGAYVLNSFEQMQSGEEDKQAYYIGD